MKTKAITKRFGPSCGTVHTVTLPAGLRVKPIKEGGTKGKYFLDEFPSDIFPPKSIVLHDAVHYGVVLEPSEVTDIYGDLAVDAVKELTMAAKSALAVQDACNLVAVIQSLHCTMVMLNRINRDYNFPGTDWVNTHPIVRMYVSKIMHLSQFENGALEISDAYDYCDNLAKGLPVDPHKFTPTV